MQWLRAEREYLTGEYEQKQIVECIEDKLPDDAVLVGCHIDQTGDVVFTFQSSEWPELPDGYVPMCMSPVFRAKYLELKDVKILEPAV